MIENTTRDSATPEREIINRTMRFEPVTPATVLSQGRFHLHLLIPSSRFTRNTQVEIDDQATVASIERDLTDTFGECVEILDACCVRPNRAELAGTEQR